MKPYHISISALVIVAGIFWFWPTSRPSAGGTTRQNNQLQEKHSKSASVTASQTKPINHELYPEVKSFVGDVKQKLEASQLKLKEIAESETPERRRNRVMADLNKYRANYEDLFSRWQLSSNQRSAIYEVVITRNERLQEAFIDKLAGRIGIEERDKRKADAQKAAMYAIGGIAGSGLTDELADVESTIAASKRQTFMSQVRGENIED